LIEGRKCIRELGQAVKSDPPADMDVRVIGFESEGLVKGRQRISRSVQALQRSPASVTVMKVKVTNSSLLCTA
jgi:hypothetical protein